MIKQKYILKYTCIYMYIKPLKTWSHEIVKPKFFGMFDSAMGPGL